MYVFHNPNPYFLDTGDCVIRAISKLMNCSWNEAFVNLAACAYSMKRIMTDNITWGAFLENNGYGKELLPVSMTIKDFCDRYNRGKYALATGSHVVAAIDGNYYDSYDSGDDYILYLWREI